MYTSITTHIMREERIETGFGILKQPERTIGKI